MRPWIRRGFTEVVKVFAMNLHTAPDHLEIAGKVREVLGEVKRSTRGKAAKRKPLEELGRGSGKDMGKI